MLRDSTTVSSTERNIELQAMSRADDETHDVHEEQPLINDGDGDHHEHERQQEGQDVDESVIESPGFFIWALTFSAGVSGLLFGYEYVPLSSFPSGAKRIREEKEIVSSNVPSTGVISSTLVSIGTDLSNRNLTTLDKSLITSSTSLFALLASPTAGILADALGRKRVLLLADILFVVGAVWQAASNHVSHMIVGRSLVGAAVGSASFVAPLYISELSPSIFRGRLVTITVMFITFGQVVAYIIGWLLSTNPHGWRFMVGVGALPALVQLATLVFMPETPRWLVKAGRKERARGVLMHVYGASSNTAPAQLHRERLVDQVLVAVEREVSEEQDARGARQHSSSLKNGVGARLEHLHGTLTELVNVGGNRRALIIACMLQGFQQLCGFVS